MKVIPFIFIRLPWLLGTGGLYERLRVSDFPDDVKKMVWDVVHGTAVMEIRSDVPPPEFYRRHASGVDALLCSRPILTEFLRLRSFAGAAPGEAAQGEDGLGSLSPAEIADLVWRRLFLDSSPLSEPARAVLTTLGLFGLPVDKRDLGLYRDEFAKLTVAERVEKTFALANLELVLYPVECLAADEAASVRDSRFRPVLRLDGLLDNWKDSAKHMRGLGYGVKGKIDEFAPLELRRYLNEVVARLNPVAIGYDWPHDAAVDAERGPARLIRDAVLPLCRERGLAFFLAAGDGPDRLGECGVWPVSIRELSTLWRSNPEVKFFLFPTDGWQLSEAVREAARQDNLLLCGPDAPLSNPSRLPAFTAERFETSGSAFHFCHAGATALEELVGRWAHLRWLLGKCMQRRYEELWRTGWRFTEDDVRADVAAVLGGNAKRFLGM